MKRAFVVLVLNIKGEFMKSGFCNLLVLFLLSFIFHGCGVLRLKNSSNNLSVEQSELILNAGSDESMRVFKISNVEDSILLRTSCDPVDLRAKDKVLDHFVSRLYATVRDSLSMGVGIAAPQVGVLKRVIWVQRFDKEGFPFEVYYNPEIVNYSDEKQDCREGCLSIPNKIDTTQTRAKFIDIEHDLKNGEKVNERVSDFTAVIFQHEIDHLDGILFIDHLKQESE